MLEFNSEVALVKHKMEGVFCAEKFTCYCVTNMHVK